MLHNSAFLTLTHTNPIVKLNFPETETIPRPENRRDRYGESAHRIRPHGSLQKAGRFCGLPCVYSMNLQLSQFI